MNPHDLSWNIDDPNAMRVVIRYQDKEVLSFSMYEAIESCSRQLVLNHVEECDHSPWLRRWNDEKHVALMKILKS